MSYINFGDEQVSGRANNNNCNKADDNQQLPDAPSTTPRHRPRRQHSLRAYLQQPAPAYGSQGGTANERISRIMGGQGGERKTRAGGGPVRGDTRKREMDAASCK